MESSAESLDPVKEHLKKIIYTYYSLVLKTREPYEYIHILSHMRSGSSLFTHLLISNPEVCGYGETHVPYDNPLALTTMASKVLYMLRRFPLPGSERFILDKTLHNHLLEQKHIPLLFKKQSHIIFLIREPIGAISSLTGYMKMSREEAVNYYTSRLEMLRSYTTELSSHKVCSAFTYDQIVNNTQESFYLLEKQLKLQNTLSENYQLVRTTGIGDASSNIYQGTIVRNKEKREPPNLSDEELYRAWSAYNRCLHEFEERCLMPGNDNPEKPLQ